MNQQAAPSLLPASIHADAGIMRVRLSAWAVTYPVTLAVISLVSPWLAWYSRAGLVVLVAIWALLAGQALYYSGLPDGKQQLALALSQASNRVFRRSEILTLLGFIAISVAFFPLLWVLETFVPSWSLRAALVQLSMGVVGLLLALYFLKGMRRGVRQAEEALERLTNQQPILELPAGGIGLLNGLLTRINALGAGEHQVGALRGQWLRKVGAIAIQEERNRLARDLHDSIKQQLFAINVSAAAAQVRWESDPAGARAALEDVRRSAREGLVEMQALLQELRPAALETVGLIEALREQCEALGYRTDAQVITEFGDLPAEERLLPGTQETLFRIAQEALSNVARHARAERVLVMLTQQDDVLLLKVRDNGQGFDPEHTAGGMGLANMRERAEALGGDLELASVPGAGTKMLVRVPLLPPADAQRAERASAEIEQQADDVKRSQTNGHFIAICGSWFGVVLIMWGIFSEGDGSIRILGGWMLIIVGIILALAYFMRSRRALERMAVSAGSKSGIILRLRRDIHRWYLRTAYAYVLICILVWFAGVQLSSFPPSIMGEGTDGDAPFGSAFFPNCIVGTPFPESCLSVWSLFGALALGWAIVTLIELLWAYQAAEEYYAQLSAPVLRADIEKAQKELKPLRQIGLLLLLLLLLTLMSFVFGPLTLITFFNMIPFSAVVDRWHLARWRRRLAQMEASE